MVMSKKTGKFVEELHTDALVPVEEQPYKVPANWVWVRLKHVVDFYSGSGFPKQYQEQRGLPIPFYKVGSLKNIDEDKYLLEPDDTIDEEIRKKIKAGIVPKNAIVFAKIGEAIKLNRRALVPKDSCIDNNLMGFRSIDKLLNNRFLYMWALKTDFYPMAQATTVPSIRKSSFEAIEFALPPLNEQKRIAEKVERLFDKINHAKQLIEEAKETFELRRAAILDKAFRGDLTRNWREENKHKNKGGIELFNAIKKERLEYVDSNRELKEIAQMFDGFALEESIDDNGWLRLKANMFCININCGGTPSEDISDSGDVPFLKVYNIVNNKIDFDYKPQFIPKDVSDSKLKKSVLFPNDVIMNIVGPPLKKIAIIPEDYPEWNMNQAIVRFRPIKYVLPQFIYYCLQYDETLRDVINETRGVVGQSNISVNQSRNLTMPIPSLEEQQEIIKILEKLIEKENAALVMLEVKETYLEKLTQSILSKAFRGELDTNNPYEESSIKLISETVQQN